jgi:hypothetical protein
MRDLAPRQILAADVLGVQRRERRMVARSRPGTRAAIAFLRASSGDTFVLFLDYLDHVVQREVAGERDSTTLDELIERHS